LYFFYHNASAITRYGFRYKVIKDFGFSDIFRYPISITLVGVQQAQVEGNGRNADLSGTSLNV